MKRFTETQKWDDPWFRRLTPELKNLWQWLLDHCDNAGVIEPDIDLASFQIGYQYPLDTLSAFGDRVVEINCGKFFIPKFIPFQYGTISRECKAHRPVFQSLEKHFPKGYPKGIHTLKEKDKDNSSLSEGSPEGNQPDLCTLEQAKSAAPMCGMTEAEAETWWHARRANGWMKGLNGGGKTKIGPFQSDMKQSIGWVREIIAKNGINGKKEWKPNY